MQVTQSRLVHWWTIVTALAVAPTAAVVRGGEFPLNGQTFTLPDGFSIERVAGPPLVNRPVSADFDEQGRLYVTDSSGSNEPLELQRQRRPHRIVRLSDQDGDGVFDRSTVYADRLMFPEGALWHDGSLYVAAPPEIWRFTDADDDGVAEHREIWFDGQTLTHCGNDLHGPYLGPDGWFYWCKGAFAEQTYQREGRPPLNTRAAHLFRRHPAGGPIEAVMTGGMDNPVEVAFTRSGERIFTTTFLVHPRAGRRDGLIHAVYGGVYGKDHGVLTGHPRTGDLLPALAHLGVAAPCGLTRLQSTGLGETFVDNLLATSFNLHKVTRHELTPQGATFDCRTSDLLLSDHLDFHPTDVLEDADGSVIVVDTGGWFRLCCPTSQLEKPDVLGAIYRIRRVDTVPPEDPRGQQIDWPSRSAEDLGQLLADPRFAVRQRALRTLIRQADQAVEAVSDIARSARADDQRLWAVWALTGIDHPQARAAVRDALEDGSLEVRLAALQSVSLHRDRAAVEPLQPRLLSSSPHERRLAAESLGRIGSSDAIVPLLGVLAADPAADPVDRTLEHAVIYALIEIGDEPALRGHLAAAEPEQRRAVLIALDQMIGGSRLRAAEVAPLLTDDQARLRDAGWWIVEQHSEWGEVVGDALRTALAAPPATSSGLEQLEQRLIRLSGAAAVQELIAETLVSATAPRPLRRTLLAAMAASDQRPVPAVWESAICAQLGGDREWIAPALRVLRDLRGTGDWQPATLEAISRIAHDDSRFAAGIRLQAIDLLPPKQRNLSPQTFQLLCDALQTDRPVAERAMAVQIVTSTPLGSSDLGRLAALLPRVGPMELQSLFDLLTRDGDPAVGRLLVEALENSPAATALHPQRLTAGLANFGPEVLAQATPLRQRIEQQGSAQAARIDEILTLLPQASVRRGLQVFQSNEAACIACHRRAYLGGDVGPDLTGIGQARSERDLLESILYPSLTFVRNYEPAAVLTTDGQIFNGVIRRETDLELTLQLDATQTMTIAKDNIEATRFSDVSIMPAGLDQQLTKQQLADLVKYLKEG